jgi:hypothetical protein
MALVLAGAIVLLAGCGGTEATIGHGAATLNCKTFPFIGSGKDDWRKSSASFGPFGMLVTDYAKEAGTAMGSCIRRSRRSSKATAALS